MSKLRTEKVGHFLNQELIGIKEKKKQQYEGLNLKDLEDLEYPDTKKIKSQAEL